MNSHSLQFEKAFNKLNPQQALAVMQTEGPVLLLAGPGTGKTEVLALRIGQILRQSDVYPSNILCLTFSNAAVEAMRSRLENLIGRDTARQISIHTYHSFCNQIINESDTLKTNSRKLINDAQKQMLIEQLIYDQYSKADPAQLKPASEKKIKSIIRIFNCLKKEGLNKELIEYYAQQCIHNILPFEEKYLTKRGKLTAKGQELKEAIESFKENIVELYDRYNNHLLSKGLMEFEDMLTEALELLRLNDDMRASLHEQYQYILVDEFQDSNQKQLDLLEMLISELVEEPNLFVVGDDDQCIFRFQGAFSKNFDWIRSKFDNKLKTILLDINYRSTQLILDESFRLIQQNHNRQPEKSAPLKAGNNSYWHKEIVSPSFLRYDNAEQEACAIAKDIQERINSGVQPSEIAILVRKWSDFTVIKKWLNLYKINWQFNQKWIDFLSAYPGIGFFNLIQFLAKYSQQNDYANTYLIQYLLHKMPGYSFIHQVLECQKNKNIDLYIWLKQFVVDKNLLEILSPNIVDELLDKLDQSITDQTLDLLERAVFAGMGKATIDRCKVWRDFITDFLITDKSKSIRSLADLLWYYQQNNIPIKIQDEDSSLDTYSVVLSTIHGSKGMEFEVVYVAGCNSNNWESPSKSGKINVPDLLNRFIAPEPESMEDFRKLLYVAMTRAKKCLRLSCYRFSETGNAKTPTKLLNEFGRAVNINGMKEIDIFELPKLYLEATPIKLTLHPSVFPLIQEKVEAFEISPTSTGVWLECQHEFLFTQVLKIGNRFNERAVFGNVVHDILYEYAKADIKYRTDGLIIELINREMEKRQCLFHSTHYHKYLEYAKWLIPDYIKRYPIDKSSYQLEEIFRMQLQSGVRIKGKLDRVELRENEVLIVDYKTGKYEQPKKQFESVYNPGTQYWRQAVLYRALIDANFKDQKRVLFEFHYPEKDNSIIECQDEINAPFIEWLEQIWKQTKELNFENCSNQTCIYCESARRLSDKYSEIYESLELN